MQNRDHAILEELLEHLRGALSDREYRTWFSQVKPLGMQGGTFTIGVPNTFTKDWIRNNYLNQLEEGLGKLGADALDIALQVTQFDEARQVDIFSQPAPEATVAPAPVRARLSTKYSFSNFVVGPNNNLAHAAALSAAERPGTAYNPLFLYGDAGLGKTHLMHAVGHQVADRFPNLSIEYVTTETFTNDLINAIRQKDTSTFRERYRNIDVLLVDDVQFIAGKEQTQEEFFHTFNSLYESGKQIILSSDRPPKNIPTLENRLRSRFEWGLITDIQPPDFETRVAILKMNADYRGVSLPEEVLELIARQVSTNIRELEGALLRVIVYASTNDTQVTRETAISALSDVFTAADTTLSMDDILRVVSRSYDIEIVDLKSKGRRQELVVPRQIAMYLIRELTQHSYPEIGQFFSNRDHSTVMYAVSKVTQLHESDTELQRRIRELRQALG